MKAISRDLLRLVQWAEMMGKVLWNLIDHWNGFKKLNNVTKLDNVHISNLIQKRRVGQWVKVLQ